MRRALCVGIDLYPFGALRGCVSDAERLATLLAKHQDGTPNFECKRIVAPNGGGTDVVTRVKLKQAVEQLFKDKAEVALLHFSGHGTENNLGGYLVTQDATTYDEGLSMNDVLKMANDSKADEVVVLLDCCHSGHMGNVPVINNNATMLREGVSIITASRGDQLSVEVGGGGLFTSLVVDALEGGAADLLGNVTIPAIYAKVEAALGAWDQRPLFKSHVSKVIAIRRCAAPISIAILRELPALFPLPAEDFPLSPEYEETHPDKEESKTKIFFKLQNLSRVHLVVPVKAKHMYDAAVQSKACRLTAAGRYYWRLAKDGRI
ncbi:caspase domain-containing protein [Sulfuricaulis sp.]|jgi:hypothetical protein|uniref:caspase family protein n=1 Tax=Sulfuricaulis sp. TaxID=2003553 RepID=UPI00355AB7E0